MTILLSVLILAAALLAAWVAQQIARYGVHGCAYAISDWFLAFGMGCQYFLQVWRHLKREHSAPDGAVEREAAPIFTDWPHSRPDEAQEGNRNSNSGLVYVDRRAGSGYPVRLER